MAISISASLGMGGEMGSEWKYFLKGSTFMEISRMISFMAKASITGTKTSISWDCSKMAKKYLVISMVPNSTSLDSSITQKKWMALAKHTLKADNSLLVTGNKAKNTVLANFSKSQEISYMVHGKKESNLAMDSMFVIHSMDPATNWKPFGKIMKSSVMWSSNIPMATPMKGASKILKSMVREFLHLKKVDILKAHTTMTKLLTDSLFTETDKNT